MDGGESEGEGGGVGVGQGEGEGEVGSRSGARAAGDSSVSLQRVSADSESVRGDRWINSEAPRAGNAASVVRWALTKVGGGGVKGSASATFRAEGAKKPAQNGASMALLA